jgi:hypothetical protein
MLGEFVASLHTSSAVMEVRCTTDQPPPPTCEVVEVEVVASLPVLQTAEAPEPQPAEEIEMPAATDVVATSATV